MNVVYAERIEVTAMPGVFFIRVHYLAGRTQCTLSLFEYRLTRSKLWSIS